MAFAALVMVAGAGCLLSACKGDEEAAPEQEATPANIPTLCTPDRWCWELPFPQGLDLNGVWAAAPDDVWFVGKAGMVVRYRAGKWQGAQTPSTKELHAVWGSSSSDVWIVGEAGVVLRFDGTNWTMVLGAPESDGGVEGETGAGGGTGVDGGAGSTVPLYAVSGTGPKDIWAAGQGGRLTHWDGTAWKEQTSSTQRDLHGLWVVSETAGFAVGASATILRYDGSSWKAVSTQGGVTGDLHAVHGTGINDVWVAGTAAAVSHFDGTVWKAGTATTGGNFRGLAAVSATSVVAAGDHGVVARWDGTNWLTANGGRDASLRGVAKVGDDVFVAGDRGFIQKWTGGTRNMVSVGSDSKHLAVSGAGATVYVVGDETIIRSAGTWTQQSTPTPRALYGVFASRRRLVSRG